jgi:tetratricopeptide (TPR) repeat protein
VWFKDKTVGELRVTRPLADLAVAGMSEQGLVALANQAESAKELATAVEILEAAYERYPASAGVHTMLARNLAGVEDTAVRDPDRAVRLARKAIELGEKRSHSLQTLAEALRLAGKYAEAVEVIEVALKHGSCGHVTGEAKKCREALAEHKRSVP